MRNINRVVMRLIILIFLLFFLQNCAYKAESAYETTIDLIPKELAVKYLNETYQSKIHFYSYVYTLRSCSNDSNKQTWTSCDLTFHDNKIHRKVGSVSSLCDTSLDILYKNAYVNTSSFPMEGFTLEISRGDSFNTFCTLKYKKKYNKEVDKLISALVSLGAHYTPASLMLEDSVIFGAD